MSGFDSLIVNEERFVGLLEKLVNDAEKLQNRPPDYVASEDIAAAHILSVLEPLSSANGGRLRIERHTFVEGRSNLVVVLPAHENSDTAPTLSLVGMHMDVVYANEAQWERKPFKFSREGDVMYGRGTTDCLGHCALVTDLLAQLVEKDVQLNVNLVAVFIADEEAGTGKVGVEMLDSTGVLAKHRISSGPVFWVDCADNQPNVGSGGTIRWEMRAEGKMFHSGFPQKGVNAFELATDALSMIQREFYKNFPPHEREAEYGFPCSSSFKATQVEVPESSVNQIPGSCTLRGDVRLIPFYSIHDVIKLIDEVVARLNADITLVEAESDAHGPDAKYKLDDYTGRLVWKWVGEPCEGLACDLHSPGFKALADATEEVFGEVSPLADTGSLPLVGDLQRKGIDVQTIGWGLEDYYHADNEQALFSNFAKGFKVLARVIEKLNTSLVSDASSGK